MKTHSKTLQIHDPVTLLIPTTKIFSEGNDLGGIFVLCCIIYRNEIAFKTTMKGGGGGGGGTNSKREIKLSLKVLFMMKKEHLWKKFGKMEKNEIVLEIRLN